MNDNTKYGKLLLYKDIKHFVYDTKRSISNGYIYILFFAFGVIVIQSILCYKYVKFNQENIKQLYLKNNINNKKESNENNKKEEKKNNMNNKITNSIDYNQKSKSINAKSPVSIIKNTSLKKRNNYNDIYGHNLYNHRHIEHYGNHHIIRPWY